MMELKIIGIYIAALIVLTVFYYLGMRDTKEELKRKIFFLQKGESNDLMDKGWNEAIEHITKNIL